MNKEQKVASKTLLYAMLTILCGYALLAIPVVGFIVECLVVFMVFMYLLEFYDYMVYNSETNKELNKKEVKKSKKKGE